MKGLKDHVRHPFWGSVVFLFLCYLFFEFGLAYLPPLFGISSAPVPSSVIIQFMLTVLLGVLIYVSAEEERWRRFKEPILILLTDPARGRSRVLALAATCVLVGYLTYEGVRPSYDAPVQLRSVHPAPPGQIDFRGETIRLEGLENPLREEGDMEDHIALGRRIYVENCVACHGDRLDGEGPDADAFSPLPADFTSAGTIAQLTESYVFWRIAKGGPGLPAEGAPWSSAMPAWEPILDEEEIWAVTIFLYEQTGHSPRTWEEF